MSDVTRPLVDVNTYFDKIFYINLDSNTERNKHINSLFSNSKITNYERQAGVVYTEVPKDTTGYRNFIKNERKYILGSLGCRDAHLEIVKKSKSRGYNKILILEDDIDFKIHPNKLLEMNYNILNDWDMLYFGGLVENHFRNQIVGGYAYALNSKVFDDIINMAIPSGMEIDNFYAKILQQMSYNYNQSGKYNIRIVMPFNFIGHLNTPSNIR
jgi:GR25 family glycosyltransferase involved in LPS biosynthesis